MVRKKGIIFLVVIIALIILCTFLFSDMWLESKIENTATSLNRAKVEIDDLEFSLINLYLRWNRLQITDPKNTMRNRIETGKCEFDLEVLPLLSKKLSVESFSITDIRINTERSEDGAIDTEQEESGPSFIQKAEDYLSKEVSSVVSPQFTSLKKAANVDSIMKILDLQSISKITALRDSMNNKYTFWEKTLSEAEIEPELSDVELQIKSIDVNNLKTADQYLAAAKKVDNIYETIKSTSDKLSALKNNLGADLKNINDQMLQVDDWVKEDYARALALAKIPDMNTENISKMIFGEKIVDQLTTYLDYIATVRKFTSKSDSENAEKPSPPRLKGQDIYFYNKNARPDFWIHKLDLSGYTNDNVQFSGLVNNIVSDQRQIGKTTDIAIEGKNDQGVKLALTGNLNYLSDQPEESIDLQYSGFSLADYQISKSKLLPNKIENGKGTIQTEFSLKGDQINGKLSFIGKNLAFSKSDNNNQLSEVEGIIQSVVTSISTVDISAGVAGTSDNLRFSISSNIDKMLMNKIGTIVNERFEKVKNDIRQGVDRAIGNQRAELDKIINEKGNLLDSEINKYEQMIDKEKKIADSKKKEIEDIYNKEKSNLQDQIMNIFKP